MVLTFGQLGVFIPVVILLIGATQDLDDSSGEVGWKYMKSQL